MDSYLFDIYTKVLSLAPFTSPYKLYREAKQKYPNITLKYVRKWLSKLYTAQTHLSRAKKFKRRQVLVSGSKSQADLDLMDLSRFTNHNNGYRFLLIAINVFTRKLMAVPLANKAAISVRKAMSLILKEMPVKRIRTDQGLCQKILLN